MEQLIQKLEVTLIQYGGMIPYHRLTSIFRREMNAAMVKDVVATAVTVGILLDEKLLYRDSRRIRTFRYICLPEWADYETAE